MKSKVKFYWKHREAIICIVVLFLVIMIGLAVIEALIEKIQ